MKRNAVLNTLRAHEIELKKLGVERLYLFGSVSRDEAGAHSDIDLFFDFDDPKFSLIELISVQNHLSDLLQNPADVMTRGSLHPALRAGIEQSAVQVF
jgi:predicted nucleotidyltransferase